MIRASLTAAARSVGRRPPPAAARPSTTSTSIAESTARAACSTLSTSPDVAAAVSDTSGPPDRRWAPRGGASVVGPTFISPVTSRSLPPSVQPSRHFSAEAKTDGEPAAELSSKEKIKRKKKSLKETVNRLKSKDGASEEDATADGPSATDDAARDVYHKARSAASSFVSGLSSTWQELLNSGKPQSINKVIHEPLKQGETAEDDDAAADKYEGSKALMYIDPEEHLTAWERMQRRLSEAPIIQDILGKSHDLYEKSGASKVKEKVDHLSEDAREAWETSQNPWVYRVSSVYDTLTAESEYAVAVRELRKLDPDFTLEEWKRDVVEHTLPEVMQLFLEGRIKELQPWLGDSVYNRLAAEMRARKKEGVYIDTHVLGIMNSEILACEPDTVERGSPIILLHYMCQQINCVRKKEDDSVVEGGEDDIRANSYVAAFQREYDEERGALNWKIVDFRFNGAIAYL